VLCFSFVERFRYRKSNTTTKNTLSIWTMACLFSCLSFLVIQVKEKKILIDKYSLFSPALHSFLLYIIQVFLVPTFFILHSIVFDYMLACMSTIRLRCVHVYRLSTKKMMRKGDIFLCIYLCFIIRNEFCLALSKKRHFLILCMTSNLL
jgi:hypothetical protein